MWGTCSNGLRFTTSPSFVFPIASQFHLTSVKGETEYCSDSGRDKGEITFQSPKAIVPFLTLVTCTVLNSTIIVYYITADCHLTYEYSTSIDIPLLPTSNIICRVQCRIRTASQRWSLRSNINNRFASIRESQPLIPRHSFLPAKHCFCKTEINI